jgi:hypothetical protein
VRPESGIVSRREVSEQIARALAAKKASEG